MNNALACVLAAWLWTAAAQGQGADQVLVNGRVFTGTPAAPWAEALAIKGDRILAVGKSQEILRLAGPSTRHVDLGGRMVVPGFNDAHTHFPTLSDAEEVGFGRDMEPTCSRVLEVVRQSVEKEPAERTLIVSIGADAFFDPACTPAALDRLAPTRPVLLSTWTAHAAIMNRAAARKYGARDGDRPAPGGFFGKDLASPTWDGVVHEYAKFRIQRQIRQYSQSALDAFLSHVARLGVTSLQMMTDDPQRAVDLLAQASPLIMRAGRYAWLAVSPQERHLAYAVNDGGATSIAIRDLRTGETGHLPAIASNSGGLVWWPTGDRLVLGGSTGMRWIDATNPQRSGVLSASQNIQVPWSVSRDGRLAYSEMNADTAFDLWTVPITATDQELRAGTPERFLDTPYFEVYPAFSPDGRWIAYGSNESGTPEVYVRAFSKDGTRAVRVSNSGGNVPRWSSTGREIVYRAGSRQLMVAGVRHDGRSWHVETPRAWTPRLLADTGVLPNFDLAGDDRLAALLPATSALDDSDPRQVTIVFNFLAAIGRRAALHAQ